MLIEMGDLDTARRSLDNLKGSNNVVHNMRRALLFLKIGDLDAAKQITDEFSDPGAAMLKPLLKMTEGRYGDAVVEWRALLESGPKRSDEVIVSQNLAVCLLYTGQLNEVSLPTTPPQHFSFCFLPCQGAYWVTGACALGVLDFRESFVREFDV